jgi:hypothetical protein
MKVLFFCSQFRDYDTALSHKMAEMGYEVTFYNDNPPSWWFREAIKYSSIRTKFSSFLHFFEILNSRKILRKVGKIKFDYVLVIKGAFLPYDFYRKLREMNPDAKFIMYQWDSHKNYCKTMKKDFLDNRKFFDRIYSFDRTDCGCIEGLEYQPLFYADEYKELRNNTAEHSIYDLFFIGVMHGHRMKILENIYFNLKEYNLRFCFLIFNYRSGSTSEIEGFKILPKTIDREEVISFMDKSRVVVDIHSSGQDGITIRTFEALAAGKKLATTNRMIMKEPFYNPSNIFVFEMENPVIPIDFISEPASPLNMDGYSIESFLRNLLTD